MPHSVHRFDRALARRPAASAVDGLRAVDRGAPDIAALRAEHEAYVGMLESLGVAVDVLEADEGFPDSMFVEDPALVFDNGAILLRPGAASRFGEAVAMERELTARFQRLIPLPDRGFADGGDVMVTPAAVFIGLSARTDAAGAEDLVEALAELGRKGVVVTPPPGVLHLKTACSLLDDETVLMTEAMEKAALFPGMRALVVPEGEEPVANALRVNDTVLITEGFPKTETMLRENGYAVRRLKLDEVMKLDAGLSCMSLRWKAPD